MPSTERLLAFARELQRAHTYSDMLEIARAEVQAALGYSHTWLLIADTEACEALRLVDVVGSREAQRWHDAPLLRVAGDAMLEEVVRATGPVVVVDARSDPRTDKAMVARWQNRTLVQLPLRLVDRTLAVVGVGTFGDEGCRAPSTQDLDYFVGMASQMTVAAARIHMLDERRAAEARLVEAEQQVFHMQRMEAVGQLASSVAHDFNNILSVILGEADVAGSELPADHTAQESLQAITEAAHRAAALTRQLLAFSRRKAFAPQRRDPTMVVQGIEPMLRRLVGARTVLTVELEPGSSEAMLDEAQMGQVLMNLVLNARDAMPDGGHITVSVRNTTRFEAIGGVANERRFVSFVVRDDGIGMDEATRARIFDPFFTTKPIGQGTGLGLSTVAGIVKQHGATIHVASEPGRGATFTIDIPASDDVAAIDRAIGTLAAEALVAAAAHPEAKEERA